MAPKRRPLDPSSRPPKKSKGANAPVSYDTFEDALDAGVIQEEKGERYRVGDKARRHYEEAVKLYELAVKLGSGEFEGSYNLARVLYHLSTSFFLPPTALTLLNSSIAHSRASLTLTTNPQLLVDSAYNLAESLISLAEIVEDTEDGREKEVEGWRREAVGLLEEVAGRQEAMVLAQREAEGGEEEGSGVGEVDEEEDGGMEVEGEEGEDGDEAGATGVARVWEETVTTPSLYLDTLLTLVSTLLLLPLAPAPPPLLAETLAKMHALAPMCAASGTPRDVDVLVAESACKLALLRLTFDANSSARETWEAQGREIIAVLSSAWETVKAPADPSVTPPAPVIELESKVSLICALGDAQALLARLLRIAHLSDPTSSPTPPTQQIWTLLSQSTTSSTTALALLTPPPSAFPSTIIPDPSTSTILLTLSSLSLLRANLALPPFAYPASSTNRATLLGNAATYARRAGEVVNASTAGGGWEKERMRRDAVVGSWRVGFWKGEEWTVGVGGKGVRMGDVKRWLEEVVEEEGELAQEEKAFWEGVAERLG